MKIRDLAHLLLSAQDLDKEVKVSFRGSCGLDITGIAIDGRDNLTLRVSGYNEDKITVRTDIEVKSPYNSEPQIF